MGTREDSKESMRSTGMSVSMLARLRAKFLFIERFMEVKIVNMKSKVLDVGE